MTVVTIRITTMCKKITVAKIIITLKIIVIIAATAVTTPI